MRFQAINVFRYARAIWLRIRNCRMRHVFRFSFILATSGLRGPCAGCHAVIFVVNATLMSSQWQHRAWTLSLNRVARLAFLTPNFTNLALFRGSWRQKVVWLFGFFFSIFGFFGGSWHILSDRCFDFL